MSAIDACIIDPLWDQFAALFPPHQDTHPLGCHRPRIPDRLVFDKLVQVLLFGCAYERIADATCSATTLRRRRDAWMSAGIMETLRVLVLEASARMIGLDLGNVAVDGCITKAPWIGANQESNVRPSWMGPAFRSRRSSPRRTGTIPRCWSRRSTP